MPERVGPQFFGQLAAMSIPQFMEIVRGEAARYRARNALGADGEMTLRLPPRMMGRSTFKLLAAALAPEHIVLDPETEVVEDA
jgi:hypothetical protein